MASLELGHVVNKLRCLNQASGLNLYILEGNVDQRVR